MQTAVATQGKQPRLATAPDTTSSPDRESKDREPASRPEWKKETHRSPNKPSLSMGQYQLELSHPVRLP